MSVTRDFDAMIADQAGERPTFRIGGQDFTMRARLPFTKWNRLLEFMRDEQTTNMDATRALFNTVLIKADRERFGQLLAIGDTDDDDDDALDAQAIALSQMGPLTDWVMEHFTGKLQSSSPGSTPGADETGRQRNVVSLSARTTAS